MNIITIILAVLIGVLYPIYIVLTYRRINHNIHSDGKFRLIDYKQTMLIFWVLTSLIGVNYFVFKQPALNIYPNVTWLSIGLLLLVIAFSYFQYKSTKVTADTSMAVKEKLNDIYHYLPKTSKELLWFILLSVSAGICEEIIFRLFLFEFLRGNTNLIIAFAITNLIFSITHIGSGVKNLASSFILGLLFNAIYYFTDNIWIAIVLHMSIDINAGILGYRVNKMIKNIIPPAS